eukprot:3631406-Pyramimonas_sp.AAC.3
MARQATSVASTASVLVSVAQTLSAGVMESAWSTNEPPTSRRSHSMSSAGSLSKQCRYLALGSCALWAGLLAAGG